MHCETVSLKEGVLWLKAQFNIATSGTALGNWLRKQRADRSMAERRERLLFTKEQARIVGKVFRSATNITVANSVLISQAVFEELLKEPPERNEKRLVELMQLAIKARDQEIREQTVMLQARRFYFDASKAVLREADKLEEINKGPGDEREKIDKIILLLFGERPDVTDFGQGVSTKTPPSSGAEMQDKEALA